MTLKAREVGDIDVAARALRLLTLTEGNKSDVVSVPGLVHTLARRTFTLPSPYHASCLSSGVSVGSDRLQQSPVVTRSEPATGSLSGAKPKRVPAKTTDP